MTSRFLAVFLVASGAVLVAESEFDHVVKEIEVHYHTKRTHIPFLGLANLVVKVARPAGTSEFKLAIFEDLKAIDEGDEQDLDRFMRGISSSRLRPLVREHSRRDGESVYIYADNDDMRATRMLIATFQRDQATVVEVKVDMNALIKWIGSPEEASRFFNSHHDDGR
ncbi:MAG TPA: hypothetical protein VKT81_05645 [Bryobacteraceae bacterium]|nr:hypothetical protein [Bryobacteraceae bacterium]